MFTRTPRRHRFRGRRRLAAAFTALAATGALIALAGAGAAHAAAAKPDGAAATSDSSANPACPAASSSTDDSCTYTYTGSEQTFTVPSWVASVTIQAVGAPGAPSGSAQGGYGASVTATVPVPSGTTTLYVEVGGAGQTGSHSSFNGGGASYDSGGGGGASDVRTCSITTCTFFLPAGLSACQQFLSGAAASICSPDPRLVVAGGGGGSGAATGAAGGNAGDSSITGAGNGTYDGTPGGDGGFGGTAGGSTGACGEDGTPFDGWGGWFGYSWQLNTVGGVPTVGQTEVCNIRIAEESGGGGGGGYYGGGSGSRPDLADEGGGGGAGSSYWVPGATDTSMSTDTTGTPEVVISYQLQQQSIAFTSTPPSPAVYGGSYTPAATGGGSGNSVTFSIDSSSTPGACSIGSSGTVSFTGTGTCTIDANQAAGGGYAAAAQAQQSITIGKAALTVTANDASRLFGAANPAFTTTITGFVNGDTSSVVTGSPSCTSTAQPWSPAGTYPITCTTGTLSAANYTFTFAAGTLTVGYTGGGCKTGSHFGPLTVTSGQALCLGGRYRQIGPVKVAVGGALDIEGATVIGPVLSTGAAQLRACGAHLTGMVSITGSTGLVVIGDDEGPACAGNTITGPADLVRNAGGVEFDHNTVNGPLTITGTTGTVPPPDTGSLVDVGNHVHGPIRIR